MSTDLREAFRFFFENAGYVVGRRAEGALQMARAERVLKSACDLSVAFVRWEYDDEPYDPGDMCTTEEAREKFDSNEWTGPFGCIVGVYEPGDTTPSHETSVWGIVVGPRELEDPCCRVIRTELACELLDDLKQAIGDHLDADLTCEGVRL